MFDNKINKAVKAVEKRLVGIADNEIAAKQIVMATELTDMQWTFFGDKSTLLYATGKLSLDESQTLHHIHTRWFRNASVAEKVVFLQVMKEAMA